MNENKDVVPDLESQISIIDFLSSSPAKVPVTAREPADEELARFLSTDPVDKNQNPPRLPLRRHQLRNHAYQVMTLLAVASSVTA